MSNSTAVSLSLCFFILFSPEGSHVHSQHLRSGNFDPLPEGRVSINYLKFFSIGYLLLLPHLFNHPMLHLYLYGLIVFYCIFWFIIQFYFLKIIPAFLEELFIWLSFPFEILPTFRGTFLAISYIFLLQEAPSSPCIILLMYFNLQLLQGAFVSFIEEWCLNPSSGYYMLL